MLVKSFYYKFGNCNKFSLVSYTNQTYDNVFTDNLLDFDTVFDNSENRSSLENTDPLSCTEKRSLLSNTDLFLFMRLACNRDSEKNIFDLL